MSGLPDSQYYVYIGSVLNEPAGFDVPVAGDPHKINPGGEAGDVGVCNQARKGDAQYFQPIGGINAEMMGPGFLRCDYMDPVSRRVRAEAQSL